jgi:hypothetical protein
MSDSVMRVPTRSLKEQFSRDSEAWKEQSDPIFGFGQRETGGASRSSVSVPAVISATKKHSVFIGRLGLSSLQVPRC